jgi:predicted GNAT family acetyltransferase
MVGGLLRGSQVRVLSDRDLPEVWELIEADPVTNVFIAGRIEQVGLEPRRLGCEIWGYEEEGRLQALCYAGANLVPTAGTTRAAQAFATRARRWGKRCSSIVGPSSIVQPMWRALEDHWGPARALRMRQPLMAITGPCAVEPDQAVRRVRMNELDLLMPASVAMFTEEVGVSPLQADGGALYRARIAELISEGRAYARIEDGEVLFKAEVGAAWRTACQVQGVWVAPHLRGQGISIPAMSAVVELARMESDVVSLYVNEFNEPARRAYSRVGFTEVGELASVLF